MKTLISRWFAKTPKLKFVCMIPEVAKSMPIVPASKVNYKWYRAAMDSFKKQKELLSLTTSIQHVAKCPGIIAVNNTGWVQKTYQDISISTNGGPGFSWKTPLDQTELNSSYEFTCDYVSHVSDEHSAPQANALPVLVKIQSPWIVYIPKGYYLLCLPIPYNDDVRFTSTIGMLDGDNGPVFLNAQLYWHCLNSEEVIPVGTPIAQYILVKKENIDVSVLTCTADTVEDLRLRKLVVESKFNPTYSKLKNITFKSEN